MDVPVICQRVNTVGMFVWGRNVIRLDMSVCRGLQQLLNGKVNPAAAYGVLVLAHEAMHAPTRLDNENEALTECRAVGAVEDTARLLGLTAQDAARIRKLVVPFDDRERRWYGSPKCT